VGEGLEDMKLHLGGRNVARHEGRKGARDGGTSDLRRQEGGEKITKRRERRRTNLRISSTVPPLLEENRRFGEG